MQKKIQRTSLLEETLKETVDSDSRKTIGYPNVFKWIGLFLKKVCEDFMKALVKIIGGFLKIL